MQKLKKGVKYRVFEAHLTFIMYFLEERDGKQYFVDKITEDYGDAFYFRRWEEL